MLVALDLKASLAAAQKRLRKLCDADFACIYCLASDVDGNQVCKGRWERVREGTETRRGEKRE